MALKIINQKNEKATFILEGTPALVNSIRRSIIEEVPTMAIEDVEFRDNTSLLYDEMIALRLGLLPLKTDLKSYILPEECKCKGEGCNRCQLKLTLKATGPCTVYASDLKSKDAKIKPVFPQTPIAKLLKGQKIELEATAMLGKGKEHAKWSPGLASYTYKPKVSINQNAIKDHIQEIIKSPSGVFKNKGGKLVVDEDILMQSPLAAEQAEAVADMFDGITFESSNKEFIFTIESWGQLSPKEIIQTAAEMIIEKAEQLQKLLKP